MIQMNCPQCGTAIECDSAKDFTFCTNCGTKVAVEKKAVVMTGNSGFAAMENGNYGAAYSYFSQLTASNPNDWQAMLYKGLSAALSGDEGIGGGIQEGIDCLKAAIDTPYEGADKAAIIGKFSNEVLRMADRILQEEKDVDKKFIYPDAGAAKKHFDRLYETETYLAAIPGLVTNEMIAQEPSLEELRRVSILKALDFSEFAENKITYIVGQKNVNKDNSVEVKDITDKMSSPYTKNDKAMVQNLKTLFNTLPSTTAKIAEFDEKIGKEQRVIEDFEQSLKQFFSSNPDAEKGYNSKNIFTRGKTRKAVEAMFPGGLTAKKEWAENSEKAIKQLESEKKKFLKENTLK